MITHVNCFSEKQKTKSNKRKHRIKLRLACVIFVYFLGTCVCYSQVYQTISYPNQFFIDSAKATANIKDFFQLIKYVQGYVNDVGDSTENTKLSYFKILESTREFNVKEIPSLFGYDLYKISFTPDQVLQFLKKYPSETISSNIPGTLFFMRLRGKIYYAFAFMYPKNESGINIFPFDPKEDLRIEKKERLVIPQ